MWMLTLLIAFTVLALLGLGIRFVEGLESENRAIEAQLRAAQMYDAALDARMKEARRFRHDVDGLLQAVEFAAASEGASGISAEKSIDGLGAMAGGNAGEGPSCNVDSTTQEGQGSLLNAVLDLKHAQCAEAGIRFACEVDDGWLLFSTRRQIDVDDVRAIVQNLLQNAYEASLEVQPASERIIEFELLSRDGKLEIKVANRTPSSTMPTFRTTKEDSEQHGIGLQIVEDVVRSYDGVKLVDFDSSARLLTIRVTL